MGRPVKKVHKSQQQRLQESKVRKAEEKKQEDRKTYIMLGIVGAVFLIAILALVF